MSAVLFYATLEQVEPIPRIEYRKGNQRVSSKSGMLYFEHFRHRFSTYPPNDMHSSCFYIRVQTFLLYTIEIFCLNCRHGEISFQVAACVPIEIWRNKLAAQVPRPIEASRSEEETRPGSKFDRTITARA